MKYLTPVIFFVYLLLLVAITTVVGCDERQVFDPTEVLSYDPEAIQPELPVIQPPPLDIQDLLWGDLDALIEGEARGEYDSAYVEQRVAEITAQREFYKKYIDADGIAIIGSDYIEDRYFYAACEIVLAMTAKHPELRKHLAATYDERPETNLDGSPLVPRRNFAMVFYHTDQGVGMLPEYKGRKPFSVGWCNLKRCYSVVQKYPNGDISLRVFVHEFAHALDWAIRMEDSTFYTRLEAAYDAVADDETSYWGGGGAALEALTEYWAHSTVRWFYRFSLPTAFGESHLKRFREKDPLMYALLAEYYDFVYLGDIESKVYQ